MSPRLRSNWRRPAPTSEGTAAIAENAVALSSSPPAAAEMVLGTPTADLAPSSLQTQETPETSTRARRAPARPRGSRSTAAASAPDAQPDAASSQPQGEGRGDAANEEPPRPVRRRAPRAAATLMEPAVEPTVNETQDQPVPTTPTPASGNGPTDAARSLFRRVLPMRHRTSTPTQPEQAPSVDAEAPVHDADSALPEANPSQFRRSPTPARQPQGEIVRSPRTPRSQAADFAQDYEPLPPPTKRKAPRGSGASSRPSPSENAIDWALGRTTAPSAPAAPTEDDLGLEVAPPELRRRRSRRGRRGRGGNGEPAGLEDGALGSVGSPSDGERPQQLSRPPQSQQLTPQRDDRGRSQLSTFESLVARQNVVLDSLLAKVSAFSSIESALMAIERRLSSQGFGATGTAAPRVGIFVDVPNIIYAAERIGVTVDFGKVLHMLTRGRELVRASAYAPISDDPQQRLESQKFVQPFAHRGYRIMTKPLKRFSDGTMKGNFDVELAMDVLTMSDRLDIVSLVSGDGDFSRLVEIVGSKGVRVEVVAFGASTSSELRAICDDYIDMQEHLQDLT